ncbi:hypothetical protein [Bacillus tequilensis]|nr:hypothetical protein [Bacillus tequilensis]SPT99119.1 Uncharacterised protein [Bacillus tequilensis]
MLTSKIGDNIEQKKEKSDLTETFIFRGFELTHFTCESGIDFYSGTV